MKRSRKTLFALLLALVMTLGLAATAWAAEGDSGTVVLPLPDGSVVNQPTPEVEVPEAYKIPFTKKVEQKGAFAPGPKDFSLEAFLPNDNGGADTTLHRFSFDTSGTGIGSFPGEMTIPSNVLGNSEGFYVREVDATDDGWTYSDEVYYARFSIDASDGKNVQTLTLYPAHKTDNGYVWDRGNPVERMSFTNIYTENLTTVEVPFTKTVKLGGNAGPGRTDFTIAVCDVGAHDLSYYPDVKYTATVTTTGAGSYGGTLIISGPATQVGEFISEGFYVREVKKNLSRWTYSDAVWFVSPEGEIFPAKMEKTDNGEFYDVINNADAVGKMTFENIYTRNTSSHTTTDEKPISSPKTFDTGVALYGVSALLSLTGTALVIKRKNG